MDQQQIADIIEIEQLLARYAVGMTQDDIDNGRLIALVGIAPVKPAEFVIFRIGQWKKKP